MTASAGSITQKRLSYSRISCLEGGLNGTCSSVQPTNQYCRGRRFALAATCDALEPILMHSYLTPTVVLLRRNSLDGRAIRGIVDAD
jgi:hypothetical protein